MSALYGAWQEKTLYGRKYMGVVRTTYVIDAEGMVRRRWDRVKVTGHATDVLSTVKLLHGTAPGELKPSKKRASATKAKRSARSRGEPASETKAVKARAGGAKKVGGKRISVEGRGRR